MDLKNFLIAISILLVCLPFNSCNQITGEHTDLSGYELRDVGNGWQLASKNDKNGDLLEEGMIKNGVKSGTWLKYQKKGKSLVSMSNFVDGQLHGLSISLDKNGRMETKSFYSDGQLDGKKYKYRLYKITEEADYKKGKMDGWMIVYYENTGEIKEKTQYKDGKKNGEGLYYNSEGELIMRYEYKDNEVVGGGKITDSENADSD